MQGAQVGSLFGELEPTCSRTWHNRLQQQQKSQASPSYRKALATEEVLVALKPAVETELKKQEAWHSQPGVGGGGAVAGGGGRLGGKRIKGL